MLVLYAVAVLLLQSTEEPVTWTKPRLVGTNSAIQTGDCFWWNMASKLERKSEFQIHDEGQSIQLLTKSSKICVGKLLPVHAESSRRYASWEWRIAHAPQAAGESVHRDQAVQIYFISNVPDKELGYFLTAGVTWTSERLPQDPAVRRKYTHFTPAIPGTALLLKVRLRELESNASLQGNWQMHELDLKELFKTLFPDQQGEFAEFDSSKVIAIAIFADSDHTGSKSSAVVKNLTLR